MAERYITPAESAFLRHRAETIQKLRKQAEERGDEDFEDVTAWVTLKCGPSAKLRYTARGAELFLSAPVGYDDALDRIAAAFYPRTAYLVDVTINGAQQHHYCGPVR